MSQAEHLALQELGQQMMNEFKLWDSRRKKFSQTAKNGTVPKYAILKAVIREALERAGYDHDLVRPDEKLRIQLRQRRTL